MGRVPSLLVRCDFPECCEESCGCQEPTLIPYLQDLTLASMLAKCHKHECLTYNKLAVQGLLKARLCHCEMI